MLGVQPVFGVGLRYAVGFAEFFQARAAEVIEQGRYTFVVGTSRNSSPTQRAVGTSGCIRD